MNNFLKRSLSAVLSAAVTVTGLGLCVPVFADGGIPKVEVNNPPLIAKYDKPAPMTHEGWERQASQLGNGFIGAMVHGGVETNKIQINEHTVWSGGPGASEDYDGGKNDTLTDDQRKEILLQVQKDLQKIMTDFTEKYTPTEENPATKNYAEHPDYKNKDIDGKVKSLFGEKDYFGSYQTLADLYIKNTDGNDTYTNYSRELDIDNSILTIKYKQNDVEYTGEYFISNPYNMMAIHLTANKPEALSKEISLDSLQPHKTISGDSVNNVLTMEGRPSDHNEDGEKFAQQVKVIAEGGDTFTTGSTVYVDDADEITIYMTAGTNYQQPTDGSYNFFSDENPLDAVKARIDFVTEYGYDKLKAAHKADYKKLYDAEKVNFGATERPEKTTDKLLAGYAGGAKYAGESAEPNTTNEDLYLETLYYQFGRYLLISSSRDGFLAPDDKKSYQGELPANLQGIWADKLSNPWNSDYHTNINVQMNYWLAEQTNLSECHMPMIKYINSLVPYGDEMTDHYFWDKDGNPVRGWTVGHECNIWGNAAPGESGASYFPTAAAWICQDIWEYYQFTKDEKFLEDNYNTLLQAALFWVDFLWEDERDHKLVANPSYSPEHGPFSLGAACDQGIIWEIFNEVINASEVLGKNDEDVKAIKNASDNLSNNLRIGVNGQFMEWKDEVTMDVTGDGGHRHTNHLFVLHPGNQVVAGRSADDDKYIEAMKKTLDTRGDVSTGWSMAWKLNFWTRLRDGERAYNLVQGLLNKAEGVNKEEDRKTADNLFDLHSPFQIDGNFGATAGMTEMLVQSQGDSIDLLPALPKAWSEGSASGIKARGNVEVDMSWDHGYLTTAVLRPANSGEYKITGKNVGIGTIVDSEGKTVSKKAYTGYVSSAAGKTKDDYLLVDLEGGKTYTIYGLDNSAELDDAKDFLGNKIVEAKSALNEHKDGFDTAANEALQTAIDDAQAALDNNKPLFDILDATKALENEIESFTKAYDVEIKFKLDEGVYKGIQKVIAEYTSKIVKVRYTVDGKAPATDSKEYNNGIYLPYGKTTVKAQAFYNGESVSEITEGTYFVVPDTNIVKGAKIEEDLPAGIEAYSGYPVTNLINGNSNSRWATSSNVNNPIAAEITFSKPTAFNSILLDEFAGKNDNESRIKEFELSYKENSSDADWTPISIGDPYTKKIDGTEHFYRGYEFESVTAAAIKLTMTGSAISIWDVDVYKFDAAAEKESLQTLIGECEKIDTSKYDENKAADFNEALSAAQAVFNDDNSTVADYLEAMGILEAAKDAMMGSSPAEDNVIATFSQAQNRVIFAEKKVFRSDWNSADGIKVNEGIKAAGPDGNKTANPNYYFEADVKLTSSDSSKDVVAEKQWKNIKVLLRSSNDGNERRSDAAVINDLTSEYITGTNGNFHIRVPLTAIPNRTGNNEAVSINWGDVQEMKLDVETDIKEEDLVDGKHPYLSMTISNAMITVQKPENPDEPWKWDHDKKEDDPKDDVPTYTKEQLQELLNTEIDSRRYTGLSYKTYNDTAEQAKKVIDTLSEKNITRTYISVLNAQRALTKNSQENWVAEFPGMNSTFTVLNSTGTQLYADWTSIDKKLDASENRGDLRLQLSIVTQYKGADVDVSDMLNKLTIKLRSTDKEKVAGDTDANNKEHNYGWDWNSDDLKAVQNGAVLELSIPLSKESTNSKGVMDWSDIQRMIVTAPLKGEYAKDGGNCTMKISDVRIIDIVPMNNEIETINKLLEQSVDTNGKDSELVENYENAKKAAEEFIKKGIDKESVIMYDVQKVHSELEAAMVKLGVGNDTTITINIEKMDYDKDKKELSYTVNTNTEASAKTGTVIVAAYNNEGKSLIGANVADNVVSDGTNKSGTLTLKEDPEKVIVFYWDSFINMMPLAKAAVREIK